MKRLDIPKELIPKLKELQEKDSDDEVVKKYDAVTMFYGMGDPMYLTFDGRILIYECFIEDKGLREAKTFAEVAMAIVVGAKVRNFPKLLSILPERPKNAVDCENCKKSGWLDIIENFPIVCEHCGGLGWKIQNDKFTNNE